MSIQPGSIVRIRNSIRKTADEYGIDEEGEMESMRGKVFEIYDINYNWVRIKEPQSGVSYKFHLSDIVEQELVKVKSQIFKFDEKHLDF